MPLEPARIEDREGGPEHQRHQGDADAAPEGGRGGSALRGAGAMRGPGHEHDARDGEQQPRGQRAPAQAVRLAEHHDPDGDRADDEGRQRRAGIADRQHQQQVVPREAQHAQPERGTGLPQGGQAPRLAGPAAHHAPEHHARRDRAVGDEPAGREVHGREARSKARRDEDQPPERACGEPREDAGQHQAPKPSSAAITAPFTKWLWSLASMTMSASRSRGSPTRLRGSMSTSLRPCSVCQWWWLISVSM